MNKIASPRNLQRELQRLLTYAQSGQPSRGRIASELQRLSRRLAATEEPDIALRQKAFNQAKGVAADRNKYYGNPLRQAAKAYYDALDKTVSEEARHKLAMDVVDGLETEMRANEAGLKVMENYRRSSLQLRPTTIVSRRLSEAYSG